MAKSASPSRMRTKKEIRTTVSPYFRKPAASPVVDAPWFKSEERAVSLALDVASRGSEEDDDAFPHRELPKSRLIYYFLVLCKPKLIQEEVSKDIFKLLVATMLLNKTTGKAAIPVFRDLMELYPSPEEMKDAPFTLLQSMLLPLGLSNIRAQRLIDLSNLILSQPPDPNILHKSRTTGCDPSPISHLPGVGKYALDSYRIFCMGDGEWKRVMPTDIPLCRYLIWRWAVEEAQIWIPGEGVVGPADDQHYESLIHHYHDFSVKGSELGKKN